MSIRRKGWSRGSRSPAHCRHLAARSWQLGKKGIPNTADIGDRCLGPMGLEVSPIIFESVERGPVEIWEQPLELWEEEGDIIKHCPLNLGSPIQVRQLP